MTQIDLSQLPPPQVVQQLDARMIRARMLLRYANLQGVDMPKVGDPFYNAFSAMAEEVTRARQEFQDISLDNMVAFSSGAALQHLGLARPVKKFITESDDQYRRRVQMAPEGFSTAGPDGAYIFHALNAHEDVLDADVFSPSEMVVQQYILSRHGDGTASAELCSAVSDYVSAEMRRPLSDQYTVFSATILPYRIVVELEMPVGPGEAQTLDLAKKRLEFLTRETHVIGGKVALSAIYGACHVQFSNKEDASFQPVIDTNIIEPTASLDCDRTQAAYCTKIIVRRKV